MFYEQVRINTNAITINDFASIGKMIVYEYEVHHKIFGKTVWVSKYNNYKGN